MEHASGVLQLQRGHEDALSLRLTALHAMGDLLGAASNLKASKLDYTKALEAMDYQIYLAQQKVCPLYLCVAA